MEVEMHVHRQTYEDQAQLLMRTNYVYRRHQDRYRPDLVAKLPGDTALPTCLEACAKFVPLQSTESETTRTPGPSSSTTAAQLERESSERDAEELDKWMSLVEDNHDELAEMT